MKTILLDFSQNVDLRLTGETVACVDSVAKRLTVEYFIVGALARDLWLVHRLSVPVARQTNDADFALAVANWAAYHSFRKALLDSGEFSQAQGQLHRLMHRNGIAIDLVPFGGIERADNSIAWPPESAFVMSVFGFREAATQTVEVRLPGNAASRVVTLPALAVLKLDAWADRHVRSPQKDAYDLQLIVRHYADLHRDDRLYDNNPYLIGPPADYELAGAWLLGKDMAQLLDAKGRERLAGLIADEADHEGQLRLAGEMMRNNAERALALLAALEDGFVGGET
jgi:predicted nucleotidyltransferase